MFLVQVVLVSALLGGQTAAAQNGAGRMAKAYVGQDRLAHVVSVAGTDQAMGREQEQVGVESVKLAPDRRTAGWLVEVNNCCTSYPIPMSLVLWGSGKRRVISDGLMVYDWSFSVDGREVAVSSGTVHGMTYRNLTLYDAKTGRVVRHWTGSEDAMAPSWGKALQE